MKPLLTLAAVGIAGVALWKLAAAVLLPLVGAVFGFIFKIALIAGLFWLAFWFFRKGDRGQKDPEAKQP